VREQFPNSQQVVVANSFHVTAVADTDHCAVRIVRAFVGDPAQGVTDRLRACAAEVPPIRTIGTFPVKVRASRVPAVAAATIADVVDRWQNNYTGVGYGLRGGTYNYTGDYVTVFKLKGYKLAANVAVSGKATWRRFANSMTVSLTIRGSAATGHLRGHWDMRAGGARARLVGALNGHRIDTTIAAP
jgi:hypothetical protein